MCVIRSFFEKFSKCIWFSKLYNYKICFEQFFTKKQVCLGSSKFIIIHRNYDKFGIFRCITLKLRDVFHKGNSIFFLISHRLENLFHI